MAKHLATRQDLLPRTGVRNHCGARSDMGTARQNGLSEARNQRFLLSGDMLRLMQKLAVLSLILLGAVLGTAQSEKKMPRKVPGASKPECAQGSICFSGEIREGQAFRKDLNVGSFAVFVGVF